MKYDQEHMQELCIFAFIQHMIMHLTPEMGWDSFCILASEKDAGITALMTKLTGWIYQLNQ